MNQVSNPFKVLVDQIIELIIITVVKKFLRNWNQWLGATTFQLAN